MTFSMKECVFVLGQHVFLHDPQIYATIRSITFSEDGVLYEVSYWYESDRYTLWVHADEISSVKETKK